MVACIPEDAKTIAMGMIRLATKGEPVGRYGKIRPVFSALLGYLNGGVEEALAEDILTLQVAYHISKNNNQCRIIEATLEDLGRRCPNQNQLLFGIH